MLRLFDVFADLGLGSACTYTVAIGSAEQAMHWRVFCGLAGSLDADRLGLTKSASKNLQV